MEIPTLSRWLSFEPKQRLTLLEEFVNKLGRERFQKLFDPIRIAVAWAWDESPDVFFRIMNKWVTSANPRLRQLIAGSLPTANDATRAKSLKILRKLALDGVREVRLQAIDVLAEDVDKHFDQVKRWAKDEDPKIRETVARHLHLTEQPKKVLPLLETLALDPEHDIHWAAAATLYDLYAVDPKSVLEVTKKMAAHENQDIRWAVALSFFEHVFADSFEHSFLLMRQWVRSGDPHLRWTLAHSLRFARASARSFQVIRALFEDRDPEVRSRVVWQLGQFFKRFEDPRVAAELLRRAFADQSKRVRDMAEEVVTGLGIDLAAITPPPDDGSAHVIESSWEPQDGEETPPPAEEARAADDDDDDDF
jgi:hypothetical protein